MKLASVEIENFRAIEKLTLALDPRLTVLHGANAHGKTSVLGAIAAGLGAIPDLLSGVFERGFSIPICVWAHWIRASSSTR